MQRPHTLPPWDPDSSGLASGTLRRKQASVGVWGPSPQTPYPSSGKVKDRSADAGAPRPF